MSGEVHQRARELAMAAQAGDISASDRGWLEAHLDECCACAGAVAALQAALDGLRAPAVLADARLVRRTQRRVRLRAAELQHQQSFMRPLWIVVVIVAAYALVSTAAAWKTFELVGEWLQLTATTSRLAFALFWVAPVLATSFLLLAYGSHRGRWNAVALTQETEG